MINLQIIGYGPFQVGENLGITIITDFLEIHILVINGGN
jgi:hypothetical protein